VENKPEQEAQCSRKIPPAIYPQGWNIADDCIQGPPPSQRKRNVEPERLCFGINARPAWCT